MLNTEKKAKTTNDFMEQFIYTAEKAGHSSSFYTSVAAALEQTN